MAYFYLQNKKVKLELLVCPKVVGGAQMGLCSLLLKMRGHVSPLPPSPTPLGTVVGPGVLNLVSLASIRGSTEYCKILKTTQLTSRGAKQLYLPRSK